MESPAAVRSQLLTGERLQGWCRGRTRPGWAFL